MACTACTLITGDLNRVIALETPTASQSVTVGDTLHLVARAIDASNAVVPDVTIVWAVIDVDSGQVGFELDSLAGRVVGIAPGSGRVQARFESIRSNPIIVSVVAAPPPTATTNGTPPNPPAGGR